MKTGIERLDNAIEKLYTAFHKGELNAMDCSACAAGNVCGDSGWQWVRRGLGKVESQQSLMHFRNQGESDVDYGISLIKKSGYSNLEIVNIEKNFLFGMGYSSFSNDYKDLTADERHEKNFQGLCAVIEYLCDLDNVPNVMDIQSLFEYDSEGKAVNELSSV